MLACVHVCACACEYGNQGESEKEKEASISPEMSLLSAGALNQKCLKDMYP